MASEKLTVLLYTPIGNEIKDENFQKWFLEQFQVTEISEDETKPTECTLEEFSVYFLDSIKHYTSVHLASTYIEPISYDKGSSVAIESSLKKSVENENIEIPTNRTSTPTQLEKYCRSQRGNEDPKDSKSRNYTPIQRVKTWNEEIENHKNRAQTLNRKNQSRNEEKKTSNSTTSTPIHERKSCKIQSANNEIRQFKVNNSVEELNSTENSFQKTPPNISSRNSSEELFVLETNEVNFQNQSSKDNEFSCSLKSNTSTPIQRVTSLSRRVCATPESNEKVIRNTSNTLCLGDFLVNSTPSSSKSTKRKTNQKLFDSPNQIKPKSIKRVLPTTISRDREAIVAVGAFSSNSAFSNDNNILKISDNEIVDKNKCAVLKARLSLKTKAVEISKELEPLPVSVGRSSNIETDFQSYIDLKNVTHSCIIDRLVNIFATVIDLNLTTNVLKELSYIINLLNVNETPKIDSTENFIDVSTLLASPTNCVYFSINALHKQKHLLALLDIKSIGIVVENERISHLAPDLKQYLDHIFNEKKNLELIRSNDNPFLTNQSFKNVHFQQEINSRTNFPSNNEFVAFKSQRDQFYKILKLWEINHLNPSWSFSSQITPKIQMLFKQCEHPNNMAHLAKLFVSQLLISSNNSAASPTEIGVEINSDKFNKLSQRLIAPSNFSVEFEFPGVQAFFREFIKEARSIVFAEQIKLALFAELMVLNNSTFEILSIDNIKSGESNNCFSNEFVVRPEVITSMLVLAKFLGLVSAQPFIYEGFNTAVDKKQFLLRNQLLPNFDLNRIVCNAYKENKLLITIPWIVQYLSMLDNVSLQLNNYSDAINFLFDIYANLDLNFSPTYVFIIKCCLGWLFENTAITELYYRRRQWHAHNLSKAIISKTNEEYITSNIVRRKTQYQEKVDTITFNPILESILTVACPFLSEFRVSIMPMKNSTVKYVSRSGRYRHITTRITDLSNPLLTAPLSSHENVQSKLIEAFLHSQSCSIRRIVEFLIERTYSAVIKDAQVKILKPSKNLADTKVDSIKSKNLNKVIDSVRQIYIQCKREATQQWDNNVKQMIKVRVKKALDALLPEETSQILRHTYFLIIRQKCEEKVNNWRYTNLRNLNFYCSDVIETSKRIVKINEAQKEAYSSNLYIKQLTTFLSTQLEELQYWLYCTAKRLDLVTNSSGELIEQLLIRLRLSLLANTLPVTLYRLVGVCTVQLLQNLIEKLSAFVTLNLLAAAKRLWLLDEMKCVVENPVDASIFGGLLTVPLIRSFDKRKESFEKLELFLVTLLNSHLISRDCLNLLFVPILKECWPSNVLNKISNILETIARTAPQT